MTKTKNYQKEKLTIDLVRANIIGILILIPIVAIYGLSYYLKWHNDFSTDVLKKFVNDLSPKVIGSGMAIIFLVMILGIVVHELIHGIIWARYAEKGFKSIKFGVLWKMLTPYCHCKEPLLVKHYILGAIMPAIILGLIPAIYSIIMGNIGLLLFGVFFTMTACGDFLVINVLRKEKMDSLVQDHPSEVGCYIYRKVKD